MTEGHKGDPVKKDSVVKRLLNIENSLERIEKTQEDQKKLQEAAVKSQITQEDLTFLQLEYALKVNQLSINIDLYFVAMWLISIGLAIFAISIAKDDTGLGIMGWVAMGLGAVLTPAFYLFFYIKKSISRTKARKRDASKLT